MRDSGTTSYIGFYRSGLTSAEHRRHITVGRAHLLDDVLDSLRQNATRASKHHRLFIGVRGLGKTHLLSCIEDEIEADPVLSARYLVVRFPEESHRTLSFADFLLGLCEILAAILPDEPQWHELHLRLRESDKDQDIIDTLVPAIRKANQEHQRTLVVMLENLGEVFSGQIRDKREIAALRKFFMESKNGCLFIATATMNFDGVTSVDEPFYDFFDVQHLDQLTEEESSALVRRTLEWEKRQDLLDSWHTLHPKLLALYRMTAGSPRLTVMLASLIAKDDIIEVRDQFRILLDRITPFYQDRLRDLGPQERALVETMAVMRDQEKTPAAIAARLRETTNHTSALLKRLSTARLVRSSPSPKDKRVRLYAISEGLFDIWLAMNLSRSARERLPFLLDFFALFYPKILERDEKRRALEADVESRKKVADALSALDHLSEVGAGDEKACAKLKLAALHQKLDHPQDTTELLHEAVAQPLDRMGGWIMRSAQSEPTFDYLTELQDLITLWDDHRSGQLESFVRKMHELGSAMTYLSYSKAKLDFLEAHLEEVPAGRQRIELRLKVAGIHHEHARWEEAERQFSAAMTEVKEESDLILESWVLNNYAQVLQATNRLTEAEEMMRRALKMDEASHGLDHPKVATILNNLAMLLQATNRLTEAEEMMRRALKIDEASHGPDHPNVATIVNNLAQLLKATNRLTEAEEMMRRTLKMDDASYGPDHPNVAIRLNNLALLLKATNRLTEAEEMMRRALKIVEASYGSDHPNVAIRLNNLAQLLQATNQLAEAEEPMRRALRIDEASYGPHHPKVAIRLNNLAVLLKSTNRLAEAEDPMRRHLVIFAQFAAQTGHEHPHLRAATQNYSALLLESGQTKKKARESVISALIEGGMTAEQVKTLLEA